MGVFVPYDPQLKVGPGHNVTRPFWSYINRRDLFPGGWLHDVGLPLTEPAGGARHQGRAGAHDHASGL